MSDHQAGHIVVGRLVRDYKMVFVLLLLFILISVLTLDRQSRVGSDAGQRVSKLILEGQPDAATVLIVSRDTEEDRRFATTTSRLLKQGGVETVEIVRGEAVDLRQRLETLQEAEVSLDAVAANDVTAAWNVYDDFAEIGATRVVTPPRYWWPDFLKISNLTGVAGQTSIYAIIAIGMTMVIITGGIDLSVGSLVALSSVVMALFIKKVGGGYDATVAMVACGCLLALAVCALAGLFNGIMVAAFRVPPFVVTLAMMMMASGLALRLVEGGSVPEIPKSFQWLYHGEVLAIPNPILLMVVLYLLAQVVMSRMVFGRYVYAIGGNSAAARLSGVPVQRVLVMVYVICGALAGLGGIMLTAQLGSAKPTYGLMYELEVIAAVAVGGTSLMGGHGRIFGTLIGAFIIAVMKNGMNLTNIDPFNQKIVLGAVLLVAVLIDTLKRRK